MPKIYDADQVTLSAFGFLLDSGLADGEFLAMERAMGHRTSKSGTDGEVVTSKTNNRLVKIKVKLMKTSDGNTKLSAIYQADRAAPNGVGVGPLMIRDRSGTEMYAGTTWIEDPPNPTFDREATEREWTLGAELTVDFPGGS